MYVYSFCFVSSSTVVHRILASISSFEYECLSNVRDTRYRIIFLKYDSQRGSFKASKFNVKLSQVIAVWKSCFVGKDVDAMYVDIYKYKLQNMLYIFLRHKWTWMSYIKKGNIPYI